MTGRRDTARSTRNRSGLRRAFSLATQIGSWTVAVLLGLVILLTVLIPRLISAEPYTVMSGSMEPTIPTGSIVVSQEVRGEDVRFDDVITYQIRSGNPQTVTHRVVGVDIVENETRFRTQGDANNVRDPEPIRPEQVRGKVIYHVPYIGYVGSIIPHAARESVATLAGIALLIYATFLMARIILARRATRTESD